MKKRLLSIVLLLAMCITLIPMTVIETEAAGVKEGLNLDASAISGSEFTKHTDLAKKLDEIFAGNIGAYYDADFKNPINAKLGVRISKNAAHYMKTFTGNTYTAWQCCAYANAVYAKLYDKSTPSIPSYVSSNHEIIYASGEKKITFNNLKKWKVRDDLPTFFYIKRDSGSPHLFIVLTYNEDYIIYADGNGDDNGLIAVRKEAWTDDTKTNIYCNCNTIMIAQPKESYYPICDCEKLNQYNADGTCSNCGRAFDFESTLESVNAIFATTQNVYPSKTPYSESLDSSFNFEKGAAVEPIGVCTNAFGDICYQVEYGDGKIGYLHESKLQVISESIVPSYATVKVAKSSVPLRNLPCSEETNENVKTLTTLSKNTQLQVLRIAYNKQKKWWYEVETLDGKFRGWIYCQNTTLVTLLTETNSVIIPDSTPSTIKKEARSINWDIKTEHSLIKKISVALYNGSGINGSPLYSGTMEVTTNSINLKGTAISAAIPFGNLTQGNQYTLVISSDLIYGYYNEANDGLSTNPYSVNKQWTFTVESSGGSSSSTPTYSTIEEGSYYFDNNGYLMYMKQDKKDVAGALLCSNGIIDNNFSFTVEKSGDYYKIYPTNTKNNLNLHAYWLSNCYGSIHNNGPTVNGDEVALWTRDNDNSQKWAFEEYNGGYLIHPVDNKELSITRTSDNRLYVTTTTKEANQIWKLQSAEECIHNYEYQSNDEVHWQQCTECDSRINETAHIWELFSTNDGSLLEKNSHYYSCYVCDKLKNEAHQYNSPCDTLCSICESPNSERPPSHSYENTYDDNQHWRECSLCHDKENIELHTLGEWIVECKPTCVEIGMQIAHCDGCKHIAYKEIGLIDHIYSFEIADGIIHYTCTMCGTTYDEPAPEEKECDIHSYDEWIVIKEASCSETGLLEKFCSVCGHSTKEVIEKNEHTFGHWIIIDETDYEITKRRDCTVCGEYEIDNDKKFASFDPYVLLNKLTDWVCSLNVTVVAITLLILIFLTSVLKRKKR